MTARNLESFACALYAIGGAVVLAAWLWQCAGGPLP
jgi:hypothetical protein